VPNATRSAALREQLCEQHQVQVFWSARHPVSGIVSRWCAEPAGNEKKTAWGETRVEAMDACLDAIGALHDSASDATPNPGASGSTLVSATGMAALRDLLQQWRAKDDCPTLLVEMAFRVCSNELEAALDAEHDTGGALPENVKCPRCGYVTADLFNCPTCAEPGRVFHVQADHDAGDVVPVAAFGVVGNAHSNHYMSSTGHPSYGMPWSMAVRANSVVCEVFGMTPEECQSNATALTAAFAAGREEGRAQLSEDHEMANCCLDMIREDLEAFGVTMSGTPPMMYNDAMRHSWYLASQMGVKEVVVKAEARIAQLTAAINSDPQSAHVMHLDNKRRALMELVVDARTGGPSDG
jgi:hypothetical protein